MRRLLAVSTRRLILGVVLGVFLSSSAMVSGCAGGMGGSVKDQLKRSTMMYFDGIRWKRFGQAALMIPAAERVSFVDKREGAREQFFVTDCEIKSLHYDSDSESALVEVEYEWYHLPSMTIQTTRLQQHWYFEDTWLIKEQKELHTEEKKASQEDPIDLL